MQGNEDSTAEKIKEAYVSNRGRKSNQTGVSSEAQQ